LKTYEVKLGSKTHDELIEKKQRKKAMIRQQPLLRHSKYFATLLIVLFAPIVSEAHSYRVYASTPSTPPLELLWVPVGFILATLFWDYYVLRADYGTDVIVKKELKYFALYFVVLILVGGIISGLSTAPPPGVGLPNHAYYGFGWDVVGLIFVIWNTIGLLLFIAFKNLMCRSMKIADSRKKALILTGSAAIYILLLLPYFAAHALSHGWAGGYVNYDCENRLRTLGEAFYGYAENHGGMLPPGKTMGDVERQVRKYLETDGLAGEDVITCPAERAFRRNPQKYVWNPYFSGKTISELKKIEKRTVMIYCPSKKHFMNEDIRLTVKEFLELQLFYIRHKSRVGEMTGPGRKNKSKR
jgi:hypothetical protein